MQVHETLLTVMDPDPNHPIDRDNDPLRVHSGWQPSSPRLSDDSAQSPASTSTQLAALLLIAYTEIENINMELAIAEQRAVDATNCLIGLASDPAVKKLIALDAELTETDRATEEITAHILKIYESWMVTDEYLSQIGIRRNEALAALTSNRLISRDSLPSSSRPSTPHHSSQDS
jgi:hypothetical protein